MSNITRKINRVKSRKYTYEINSDINGRVIIEDLGMVKGVRG